MAKEVCHSRDGRVNGGKEGEEGKPQVSAGIPAKNPKEGGWGLSNKRKYSMIKRLETQVVGGIVRDDRGRRGKRGEHHARGKPSLKGGISRDGRVAVGGGALT